MERGGQFDHAQARTQMSAGDRNGRDGFGAEFIGKLPELRCLQCAKIGGHLYRVEQRRIGRISHAKQL
jgi:hypothetical protein